MQPGRSERIRSTNNGKNRRQIQERLDSAPIEVESHDFY